MHIVRLFVLLASTVSAFAAQSQVTAEIAPKVVWPRFPSYEAISFASEGPAYGHADSAVRGRFHRVLFINEGLAYDDPSIRLETMTYGDEGCCRKLVGAQQFSVKELQSKGVQPPDPARTELVFVRWHGPREFEYKYGSLACRLSGIGESKVTVSCQR